MGDVYLINGEQVAPEAAVLPIKDMAILRGYGVFDFTRTYNGQPWHLADHVARLFESAAAIELALPWSQQAIIDMVHGGLRHTTHADCFIRLIVTAGDGINSVTPGDEPRIVIIITAAVAVADPESDEGLRLIAVNTPRYLPGVKSLNYIPAMRARKRALSAGADDALYLDDDGLISEATTANFFIVKDGVLHTPPLDNALRGITRQVVLDIATSVYPVTVAPLPYVDVLNADEAFITSSSRQIVPVIAVDGQAIGTGKPGTITRDLMRRFNALTAEVIAHG